MSRARLFTAPNIFADTWARRIAAGELPHDQARERFAPINPPLNAQNGFDEAGYAPLYEFRVDPFADLGDPENDRRIAKLWSFHGNFKGLVDFVEGEGTLVLPRFNGDPARAAFADTRRGDDGFIWANTATSKARIRLNDEDTDLISGNRDHTLSGAITFTGSVSLPSGSVTGVALDDLDDVVITAPVSGEVLRYNGGEWADTQLGFSDLGGSIADVQVPSSAVTQHEALINHDALLNAVGLAYDHSAIDLHIDDGTIHFTQAAISIPLSQISDVTATAAEVNLLDLSGLTAGWGLIADTAATASWQQIDHVDLANIGVNSHAVIDTHIADTSIHFTKGDVDLDDLGNVTVPTPTDNDVLRWDAVGGAWVDESLDVDYLRLDGSNVPTADIDWNSNRITGLDSILLNNGSFDVTVKASTLVAISYTMEAPDYKRDAGTTLTMGAIEQGTVSDPQVWSGYNQFTGGVEVVSSGAAAIYGLVQDWEAEDGFGFLRHITPDLGGTARRVTWPAVDKDVVPAMIDYDQAWSQDQDFSGAKFRQFEVAQKTDNYNAAAGYPEWIEMNASVEKWVRLPDATNCAGMEKVIVNEGTAAVEVQGVEEI